MSDKGLFAVMRYSDVDAYLKAQAGMKSYADADRWARESAGKEPEKVFVVVKIVAVMPGRAAPLSMDTRGNS
jgi:hypothetical protein